ncbi:MAG: hypothetical protein ACI8TP_005077 [Acidimicrobiales bacterium]|jgi:hypothetical protein
MKSCASVPPGTSNTRRTGCIGGWRWARHSMLILQQHLSERMFLKVDVTKCQPAQLAEAEARGCSYPHERPEPGVDCFGDP